jgi:alpha-ribazole phosphatase
VQLIECKHINDLEEGSVPPYASFMKTLTFVRHGQSLANIGGVTMENREIPLSEVGHRQAQELSLLLPGSPSLVLVSPFRRAIDTASPYCAKHEASFTVLELLREFTMIDPALLAGMTGAERRPIADAHWEEADPFKRMGARAETFLEFDERVAAFVHDKLPTLPEGAVVFGHGQWFALLVWKLLGFSANDSFGMKGFRRFLTGFPVPNGAVYRLVELAPTRWTVEADETILRQASAWPHE